MAQQALYGGASARRITIRDLAAAKAARRALADAHRLRPVRRRDLRRGRHPRPARRRLRRRQRARLRQHAARSPSTSCCRSSRAVVRGTSRALVVADLPFGSYEASPAAGARHRGALPEGGRRPRGEARGRRTACSRRSSCSSPPGIPVMGHLGLTPQSVNALRRLPGPGPRRGRRGAAARREGARARRRVRASCSRSSPPSWPPGSPRRSTIPTIGIGAGAGTRRAGAGLAGPRGPRRPGPAQVRQAVRRPAHGADRTRVAGVRRRRRRRHLPRRAPTPTTSSHRARPRSRRLHRDGPQRQARQPQRRLSVST